MSFSLRDRLRYRFDRTLSKGTKALIAWLFALTSAMVVAAATLVTVMGVAPQEEGGEAPSFAGLIWSSLMRALDAGNVAGDTGSAAYVGVMFSVTLGGIFVVSILIGIINRRRRFLRREGQPRQDKGHRLCPG